MKTTELYIEQVLIGFLIIVIVLLPWVPEVAARFTEGSAALAIVGGTTALGLGFWLGIPFDRIADTLSERLLRHNRLRFALNLACTRELPAEGADGKLASDLYPEDELRVRGLGRGPALVEWIDYHRSRIRLARAFAVYGPALTVTLSLGVWSFRHKLDDSDKIIAVGGIVAAYLLWAILARVGEKLPRTDRKAFCEYAAKWGHLEPGSRRIKESGFGDGFIWVYEWPVLVVPVALLAAALLVGLHSEDPYVQLAGAGGTLLTLVFAWSWWRISHTFRTYLRDIDLHAEKKA
jgi:hypothetical protein